MRGLQELSRIRGLPFNTHRFYNSSKNPSITKTSTIQPSYIKEMNSKLYKNPYAYSLLDICNCLQSTDISEEDVLIVIIL